MSQIEDQDPEYDEQAFERTWEGLLGEALSPGDVLAGKYRVDELVGFGAMGFVLRAWHLQLEEPVAVKFLLPELAKSDEALVRFEREARAAFKIKSQHVTRVLDVGRLAQGQPFMVMEFLEGHDLGARIYEGPMPVTEVVDYLLQACEAIGEAHGLGIVHRDLKPENLYLTRRGDGSTWVKVLDFGLSKVVSDAPGGKRERALTAESQVMGTAHYMSPEQWVAAKDVGPSADIWALGVILYEAITGESPFMRNNLAAMCNAVLRFEPPSIETIRPDAPPGLDAVVRRCIAKKVEERHATVAELVEDLLPYGSDGEHYAPPVRPSAPQSSAAGMPSLREPSMVNLRPAGVPPLGLLNADGTVDSWADILREGPPSSKLPLWIGVALATLAMVAVLVWAVL